MKRTRRLHNRILSWVFLGILLLGTVLNILTKDNSFSEEENRNLASFPAFSLEDLSDGTFFSGLEDYVADQFFARNAWISMKMTEDKILGRKESGGVFLGKKGYLLGQPEAPEEGFNDRIVKSIRTFAERYQDIRMHIMIVPGSALVTPQYLPANAQVYDQIQDINYIYQGVADKVDCVNAQAKLGEHSDEYIYYKTDHHWTSLGAMYGFQALCPSFGIDDGDHFNVYPVATDFQGTLSSKSGSHSSTDQVDIYVNEESDVKCYVEYLDTGEIVSSIYKSSALDTKDKYTVFFGGNHPILNIITTNESKRVLLIFKDSYCNSLIQFLYPHFSKIIMVDPRYYYDNINTVINTNGVTDILYLYSADTFLTDGGLADVLDSAGEAGNKEEYTMTTEENPVEGETGETETSEASN